MTSQVLHRWFMAELKDITPGMLRHSQQRKPADSTMDSVMASTSRWWQ